MTHNRPSGYYRSSHHVPEPLWPLILPCRTAPIVTPSSPVSQPGIFSPSMIPASTSCRTPANTCGPWKVSLTLGRQVSSSSSTSPPPPSSSCSRARSNATSIVLLRTAVSLGRLCGDSNSLSGASPSSCTESVFTWKGSSITMSTLSTPLPSLILAESPNLACATSLARLALRSCCSVSGETGRVPDVCP